MSRDEMRKIMAGSGSGPGCAEFQQTCGGAAGTACCGGLSCNGGPGGGTGTCVGCLNPEDHCA